MPCLQTDDLSDAYIADLLVKDSKKPSSRFGGIQNYLPQRATTKAHKPNLRFLNNLIRDTDGHNAALRDRDARERERARTLLEPKIRGRGEKRFATNLRESEPRMIASSRISTGECTERRTEPKRSRRVEKDRKNERRQRSNAKFDYDRLGDQQCSDHEALGRSKRRRHHVQQDSREIDIENVGRVKPHLAHERKSSKNDGAADRCTGTDSDPLDDIIGPRPEEAATKVQSRGRGAFKSSTAGASAMDTHFSRGYNPTEDVALEEAVGELDDWDQALEALRDRQKWQRQGAERLRAAGFDEQDIDKWSKGQIAPSSTEKDINDVRWQSSAQDREWDKGKILAPHEVVTKADWGRLI